MELRTDVLADKLLELLDATRTRTHRVVVDEIGAIEQVLEASSYSQRFHDFLAALVEALRLRAWCDVAAHL